MPGSSGREIKLPFTILYSGWRSKVPSAEMEEVPPSHPGVQSLSAKLTHDLTQSEVIGKEARGDND